MKSIALGLLAALLVTVPTLATFANSPPPDNKSDACKKLLADERRLEKAIREWRLKIDAANAAVVEADRAIAQLAGNPTLANAVSDLKAERARNITLRDTAIAREQADKDALKADQENELRVCLKTSKSPGA